MQYNVPQFVEIEDKVIGPLTLKQFLWILVGVGLLFLLYKLLIFPIFLIIGLPIGIFCGFGAFYKIQNKTFAEFILASLGYFLSPKLYLWKKENEQHKPEITKKQIKKELEAQTIPTKKFASQGKINEMSWKLNIK